MRRRRYRPPQKKRRKNGSTFFRIFICLAIVCAAIIAKNSDSPIIQKTVSAVKNGLKTEEAAAAISRAARIGDEIADVFRPKTEETPKQEEKIENVFGDESYYSESTKEIEKELEAEKKQREKEEKELSVEKLSFEMSEDELADDTKPEVFRIPPPSYCSYEKYSLNLKYRAPLHGVITSKFGYRNHPILNDASFHTGLDIAAKQGTAVTAFAGGTVAETGKNATYGNYLLIDHGNGITSFYGHNSKVCVKKGKKVKLGQKVAEVGTTGMSTGPHLHFEIRKNKIRLDPALYISPETV